MSGFADRLATGSLLVFDGATGTYLQEKGLLRRYYKRFRAGRKEDPSGYATLVEVLGEDDMAAFRKRWEAWVLTLRYP